MPPSTVTLRAWVNTGSPSTSATIAGTAADRPSDASLPASTRSTSPTVPIAPASARAVPTASEPASASSVRCTAASAPIDSALRIASVARSGPIDTTVTAAAVGLLELQRLLDGALVDLVEHRVGGVAVQGTVRPAAGARSRCRAPACTRTTMFIGSLRPPASGPTPSSRRVHKCYQPVYALPG